MSKQHQPSFEEFRQHSQNVDFVPVYREIFSDLLTPVTAFLQIEAEREWAFLFESVVGGERVGRYSFLGSQPIQTITAFGNSVTIADNESSKTETVPDPLEKLQEILDQHRAVHLPGLPRFCGGAVGYAGYDAVRYAEHLPNAPADDRQLPDLCFAIFDQMIVFDHIKKTVLVIAHANAKTDDPQAEYRQTCDKVDALCETLCGAPMVDHRPAIDAVLDHEIHKTWTSDNTQEEYEAAVEACKEYIRAGDIFQVVISQRLQVESTATPLSIYRALRVVNPSPFMFLMRFPGGHLVGSSPEIMVRAEDGLITVRPLAGTRPRGANAEQDQRLAEELLADPKERAEHVMLVDLARNDVGRVADYDTVEISDVMVVERYSHVMHITSNVTGRLNKGMTALDALRAALPAGTVSGAPKVRAMEIIDSIEKHRRGPYAGAVGYIDFTGNMDTCIALRTLVIQGNQVYIQAGAGLVADSVPATEYQETLNKAKAMLKAIELAETQFGSKAT